MNLLDLLIVLAGVAAVSGGWRLGFIARVGSWAGGVAGLLVGARLAPGMARSFSDQSPLTVLWLVVATVLGLALLGQAIGLTIGARIRHRVPRGPARSVDRGAGAVAGAAGVLVLVWLLLPALGEVPGSVARLARESAVVGFVDDAFPAPPSSIRSLGRLVGQAPWPEVFVGLRPAPETGPPPTSLALPVDVQQRVAASTVNVEARGCGGVQEGSGYVAEPGTVVTNAHVVAGTSEIEVLVPGLGRLAAEAVAFDDNRDLAVLRVPGLDRPPLSLDPPEIGTEGAVFGHPAGQDELRIAPAAVREEITAVGRDIYGEDRVERRVLVLAADLARGDSGAAVADPAGAVLGVAFAIAPDQSQTAYALHPAEVQAILTGPRQAGFTGRCQ